LPSSSALAVCYRQPDKTIQYSWRYRFRRLLCHTVSIRVSISTTSARRRRYPSRENTCVATRRRCISEKQST